MRVASFSPLPPARSGIADYSFELVEAMAEMATVDAWVTSSEQLPPAIDGVRYVQYDSRSPDLSRLAGYDGVIYHMGNDARFHAGIYEMFRRWPGIVVLHDYVLHHFIHYYTVTMRGDPDGYIEEMRSAHGHEGEAFARQVLTGEVHLLKSVDALTYPLNAAVLEHAWGVIVHSDFARRLVVNKVQTLPVQKVFHFGKPVAHRRSVSDLRMRYGLPARSPVISSFGHFVEAKRIPVVLEALGRIGRSDVTYLLIGQVHGDIESTIDRLGLRAQVRIVDWVPLPEMLDYMALSDVVVNLRGPNMGETSGVVCRAMAAGVPLIVSTGGWFDELPSGTVTKVDIGHDEVAHLADALTRLLDDRRSRSDLGVNAQKHAARYHDLAHAAEQYLEFVEQMAGWGASLRSEAISTVAGELSTISGGHLEPDWYSAVAQAVGEIVNPRPFTAHELEDGGDLDGSPA
jgi:glycosyltransferase involved in cell wall biosynthesis